MDCGVTAFDLVWHIGAARNQSNGVNLNSQDLRSNNPACWRKSFSTAMKSWSWLRESEYQRLNHSDCPERF